MQRLFVTIKKPRKYGALIFYNDAVRLITRDSSEDYT